MMTPSLLALLLLFSTSSDAFVPPQKARSLTTSLSEKIAKDVLDLVGGTPLVQLNRVVGEDAVAQVVAKLESSNPANSVKDRIAKSMILEAEKRGDITPGKTILVGE